jgi:hypothetical protein
MDEFVLDIFPNNPRHLITVQFHHRILDLDLLKRSHIARVYEN